MTTSHELLWRTNVGSHMWKMNHENSDLDVFECYILPTREILKGRIPTNHFTQDSINKIDTQRQEISKVTSEIIKSNINYIGYIFSPIVLEGNEFLTEYRKLARKVISKQVYNSVRGMAIHNYNKYQKELGEKIDGRRWGKILRFVCFGITLMDTERINFAPMNSGNIINYNFAMKTLDEVKENGKLQEYPSDEDIDNLWDFVVNERIKRLEK